jgi:ATP/ADP translocase
VVAAAAGHVRAAPPLTKAFWQAALAQLTETQRKQYASFRNKATGWFTVAAGATLLAAGETWQIIKHYGWPAWLFWLLIAIMLTVALLNTAVQMISGEHARRSAGAEPAPAAEHR